jgi:DNA processing protein
MGAMHFFQLQAAFPDLSAIFHASASQLQAAGLSPRLISALQKPDAAVVEKNIRWAEHANHHILSYDDPRYPVLLKETVGAPAILFVAGDVDLLQTQQIAIVGSRNPTPSGVRTARDFAQQLSQQGLTITSGLALGIDAASHQATLDSAGKTIAVLGSGVDVIYPRTHKKLAEAIVEKGALVSEYPLGMPPKAVHFPQRNRVVSGLSLGVLVVEATMRSGSLITGRIAAEQGREVFAIPSSIYNPLARGCHFLIRQGAKLVETPVDIVEELGPLTGARRDLVDSMETAPEALAPAKIERAHQAVLDHIGFEATSIDTLVARTGFSAQFLASVTSILELQGIIQSVSGGYSR